MGHMFAFLKHLVKRINVTGRDPVHLELADSSLFNYLFLMNQLICISIFIFFLPYIGKASGEEWRGGKFIFDSHQEKCQLPCLLFTIFIAVIFCLPKA